jgi:hypothetical protein
MYKIATPPTPRQKQIPHANQFTPKLLIWLTCHALFQMTQGFITTSI